MLILVLVCLVLLVLWLIDRVHVAGHVGFLMGYRAACRVQGAEAQREGWDELCRLHPRAARLVEKAGSIEI